MSTTTTALLVKEVNGPFSLGEVFLDTIRDDEALVEIQATGVCHTDVAVANGTLPGSAPAVLGHEGGGVVKQVGSAVKDLSPGDKVLLSFAHCETCDPCMSDHPAYCHSFTPLNFGGKRTDGTSTLSVDVGGQKVPMHSGFFGQSSFARHTIVSRSSLVKVADDVDLAVCSPLGCGLQTGAGAVLNTLNVQPDKSLAVFGVGSVGMSAVMAGKIRGAGKIIAVDVQQSRLDLAKTLGATHTICGSGQDVVDQLRKICPPNGVDYALDCSGIVPVIETMIECLGTLGKGATVGAPTPGKKAGIDVFAQLINGRQYLGCCEGDSVPKQFIPYLIDEFKRGNYPIDKLVSLYDINDFETAIRDMKEGKALKAVLTWA